MRIRLPTLFVREAETFALACACEDCAQFDLASATCAHGYPVDDHRREAFSRTDGTLGTFCKEFELA